MVTGRLHNNRGKSTVGLIVTFCILLSLCSRAGAALIATLEGPEDRQTVSGVAVIRGWAFSDTGGVTISKIDLLIDGTAVTPISCCSSRTDVGATFPQFPADNTNNSGFGLTINYGLLSPGSHTVLVRVTDSSGAQQDLTSAVTVVRAGSSPFLDQVELNGATAQRDGQDVVLTGVRVRDKASQQVSQITARLRWFRNIQGLGLVEAATTGPAALQIRQSRAQETAEGAQVSPIKAIIESPSNGQTVSGIAVIRGWAFSSAGRTIRTVQLLVDGNPFAVVPCCSPRGDVAAGFPGSPQALNSGFGITVNYGGLTTGVHTFAIKITDSAGATKTLYKGVLGKRQGGATFVSDLDLSAATVRIANGTLVLEGVKVSAADLPQPSSRIQRYRFDVSAQAFLLTEESAAEITVTNTNSCEVNGNVSSLNALKQNPGADGVSFPEVVKAVNNTSPALDVLVTWQIKGTLACASLGNVTALTRGAVTLDGDVDGDGVPDVTLEEAEGESSQALVAILFSYTTVRYLHVTGSVDNPVTLRVVANQGTNVTNVALIGLEVTSSSPSLASIAAVPGAQPALLSDVLINGCRFMGNNFGVVVGIQSSDSGGGRGEMRRVTVVENDVQVRGSSIAVGVDAIVAESPKAILSQLIIANNTIESEAVGIGIGNVADERAATDQIIEASITGNVIRSALGNISINGGSSPFGKTAPSSQNTSMVEVYDNLLNGLNSAIALLPVSFGVGLSGGIAYEDHNSTKNMVAASISDNELREGLDYGVVVAGGDSLGARSQTIQNSVTADIQHNATINNKIAAIVSMGGFSSSGNIAETMIANNTISNTTDGNGIIVAGGTAKDDGDHQQGASGNTAMGTIQGNTVQQSTDSDIAVFGGQDDAVGPVTNNLARQTIIGNTASKVSCQDGLPTNKAECKFANTSTEPTTATQREEKAITVQPAVVPLLDQLDQRMADLRTRAQETTSAESQAELLRLAERLAERKAQVMMRRRQEAR